MATSQKRQFNDIYTNVNSASASLSPALVTTGTTGVASSIAVPGSLPGDVVIVSVPASLGALVMSGEVQVAGTVVLKFQNVTAGSLTPPAAAVYTAITMTLDPKMSL